MTETSPHDHRFDPSKASRLDSPRRLETQVSKETLSALLSLRGDEDLVDLGSGTGFYTDIVAGMTSGRVYAVELQPEMIELYRARGIPENVRVIQADIRRLPLAPQSIDVAYSIATYHETAGDLDFPSLLAAMRPPGRLAVVDWRSDPESWESGPPVAERFSKEQAAESLGRFFEKVEAANVGLFMFSVVAWDLKPIKWRTQEGPSE